MHILGTPIDAITWEFLEQLRADRVQESPTHDYKRHPPPAASPRAKAKFLQSAVAFANTQGGVFVFGFDAPEEGEWTIPGVSGLRDDSDIARLQLLLRSGLEPPLLGARSRVLDRPGEPPVLLLGVPRSPAAPHRVALQAKQNDGDDGGGAGFYLRGERGNHPMTVPELRAAFEQFDRWIAEADAFRDERIRHMLSGDRGPLTPPGSVRPEGAVYLHLLPLGRVRRRVELPSHERWTEELPAAANRLTTRRPTAAGLLAYTTPEPRRHLLFLRNGGIEAAAQLAAFRVTYSEQVARGDHLERHLVEALTGGLTWAAQREVSAPFSVYLTLCHCSGVTLHSGGHGVPDAGAALDAGIVQLLPLTIESDPRPDQASVAAAIRPLLDELWQAASWRRSPNFDAHGRWTLADDYTAEGA
ncbi:MAG: helix-turn-helix domain-containing protein [Gemmatimonadaceae bacterium]